MRHRTASGSEQITGSTLNVLIPLLPLRVLKHVPQGRATAPLGTAPGSDTPSLTVGLLPRSAPLPVLQANGIYNSTSGLFSRKESADVQANRTTGVDGRERR